MEVILNNNKNSPSCPHGPCLLFERYSANGSMTGRKFFACSASRDRSECNFFQWADEEMSEKRKKLWENIIEEKSTPFSHEKYMKRLEAFNSLPADKRKYCKTCSLLIINELDSHSNHKVVENISSKDLIQPSSLFEAHLNKKVEAQYFFSESTVNFIVSLLKNLGFSKFVLIGAPRIHEYIISQEVNELSSLLMDIDCRYMQFFSPEQFCHYNMFNNHFFAGKGSKNHLKKFLSEHQDKKVVMIIDPPFGGLIDAISHSLKMIDKWWQEENKKIDHNIPMLWIFPYFHEGRIQKNMPNMKMMDYKVEYVNHKKFTKSNSNNSPVRIFTNISTSNFILPTDDGYRYCDKCQRFVFKENMHCMKCNACTTKHGKTYHHCFQCKQCVKSSYIHCKLCNKCGLSSEIAEMCKNCKSNTSEKNQDYLERCLNCNSVGHRKRSCPEVYLRHNKRRKFKKKK